MTNLATDPLIVTSLSSQIGTITSDMFGAIGINSFGFNYFEEQSELLGLTDIRFPGGTLSEHGYVIDGLIRLGGGEISLETLSGDRSNFAFDLTHPELISPVALAYDDENHLQRDDIWTFSQVIELAVARGVSVGLVIPVERYFTGADFSDPEVRQHAIDMAVSDISVFLDRLKNGEYNNGVYPETFTLEIGNEAYANPIEYAVIAKAMIDEIAVQLDGSGINYEIAFQMGRGSFDFDNLLQAGYFDPFFDGTGAMIPGLDELDFIPGTEMSYPDRQTAIDEMMTSILGDSIRHIDAVRHHVLSFNSSNRIDQETPLYQRNQILDHWISEFADHAVLREDFDYYVSAWSTTNSDDNSLPYALSAAANTLELFSYFMEFEVDRAAVWGVVGAFRYSNDMSSTVVTDRLSDFLSPQAAIIQLMTSNIIDSDYLGSGGSISDGYVTYTYESDSAYTVFFVAGELGGEVLDIDVDLGLFGDLQSVSVVNLDIVDGAANGASNLTVSQVSVIDGMLDLSFDQDHEIVMITLEKDDSTDYGLVELVERIVGQEFVRGAQSQLQSGTEESDTMSGGTGSDIIYGAEGDDTLDGGGGRSSIYDGAASLDAFDALGSNNGDFLFGGAGNDTIRGNAGNDLISGGEGDDNLWGGSGFDTFVFTEGHDEIHDFNQYVDTILVEASNLGDLPIEVWLQNNSEIIDGALVMHFSDTDVLTVHGVSAADELLGHIETHYATELV